MTPTQQSAVLVERLEGEELYRRYPACRPFAPHQMTDAELKQFQSNAVGVGMVIAAAIIADDNDVLAEEILCAAGLETVARMRKVGCDDYDINKLRPVVTNMNRRKRWDARKRATTPTADEGGENV